jgi:GTP-dependent phosphoenolpyruvate carboxykinase
LKEELNDQEPMTVLTIVVALTVMTGVANASPLTCSGKLWKGMEIGHGIYQCSVASATAAKKILSVCHPGKRCTVRVEIVPKTDEEMADQDGVVITDKDKVLWVRPGAADDSGFQGSRRD